jgi:hypothetical protein
VALAILGSIINYSPVPYNDMWSGYLQFYTEATNGDVSAWWAQHNEHRIILSRILFWSDIKFFNGTSAFLIIVNLLLAAFSSIIFFLYTNKHLNKSSKLSKTIINCTIILLLFSRMQKGNFDWAFQSQFFLAYSMPLLAFYLLYRAHSAPKFNRAYFISSCLLGIASAGTMANGVLALPLLVMLSLALRMKWQVPALLSCLSIATLLAYFHNYQSIAHHGSTTEVLLHQPLELMQYILLYIGSPFHHMFWKAQIFAYIASIGLISSSVFFLKKYIPDPKNHALELSLLTFILYIGITAVGTGSGRLIFGTSQALVGRYTTPALMAWVALLILLAPKITHIVDKHGLLSLPKKTIITYVTFIILLFSTQIRHIHHISPDEKFERKVLALALELNIADKSQHRYSGYPEGTEESVLHIAQEAAQKNISIFNDVPLKDARELIGKKIANDKIYQVNNCTGEIEKIEAISNSGYSRITGWLTEKNNKIKPASIRITNAQNKIIGYALIGKPREDLQGQIGTKAEKAGFKGYIIANSAAKNLNIFTNTLCKIQIATPEPLPYIMTRAMNFTEQNIATHTQIITTEWTGSDYKNTMIEGYQTFGSFYNDCSITKSRICKFKYKLFNSFMTGKRKIDSVDFKLKKMLFTNFVKNNQIQSNIILKINSTNKLYYRSGANTHKQFLILNNGQRLKLPSSPNWSVLQFHSLSKNQPTVIKLVDEGTKFNEWSAIMVK